MPYADEMIDYLNQAGIRTAVISNNAWSGEAIKERFDRLLPNNRFEFIISSCDYMIRKPDKRLFEIALMKSGLTSDKVWYCGDQMMLSVQITQEFFLFIIAIQIIMPMPTLNF